MPLADLRCLALRLALVAGVQSCCPQADPPCLEQLTSQRYTLTLQEAIASDETARLGATRHAASCNDFLPLALGTELKFAVGGKNPQYAADEGCGCYQRVGRFDPLFDIEAEVLTPNTNYVELGETLQIKTPSLCEGQLTLAIEIDDPLHADAEAPRAVLSRTFTRDPRSVTECVDDGLPRQEPGCADAWYVSITDERGRAVALD
jgi:hypothetical protein